MELRKREKYFSFLRENLQKRAKSSCIFGGFVVK